MQIKKYAIKLISLLAIYHVHAMELPQLSLKQKKRAQTFAKLIYKYPNGFEGKKEKKDAIKTKMDLLLKQETAFGKWVIKYHNMLNNAETEEILNEMYNNKFLSISKNITPGFPVDLKNKIFSTIVSNFLFEDAKQYYAISNALEFMKISKQSSYDDDYETDTYKSAFLSEINQTFLSENNDIKFELKITKENTVGNTCKISLIKLENAKQTAKSIYKNYSNEIIENLEKFLTDAAKKIRINNFKILLRDSIDDLSKTNTSEKAKNKFVKLLGLKSHNNKQYIPGFKGSDEKYIILPLEELLKIEDISYDIEFYNHLAQSNAEDVTKINIDGENLQKWQQFSEARRDSLKNILINLKHTPYTFAELAIIHGAFLTNAIMPDVIMHCVDTIIPTSGWKNGITRTLSFITSSVFNVALGAGFFPQLYAKFNSHRPLVEACIKAEHIREEKTYAEIFCGVHILHTLCSLIGNHFLSFVSLPAQIIGISAHGLRIIIYYITTKNFNNSRHDIYYAKELKTASINT